MALSFHPKPDTILVLWLRNRIPTAGNGQTPAGGRDFTPPAPPRRPVHCGAAQWYGAYDHPEAYPWPVELERAWPKPWNSDRFWVKADILATVAFHRLELISLGRDQEGSAPELPGEGEVLASIRRCALHALGRHNWHRRAH